MDVLSEPDYSPARIAAVEVDPEMLGIAIEELMAQLEARGLDADDDGPDLDTAVAAAAALSITDPDFAEASESDEAVRVTFVLTSLAIAARMKALFDLNDAGHLRKWEPKKTGLDDLHPAVYEAACLSRLQFAKDGSASFQLLEFLSHAARAEKELVF